MTYPTAPRQRLSLSVKPLVAIGLCAPLLAGCLLTERQLVPRDDAIRINNMQEGYYCEIDPDGPDNAEDAASYLYGCFELVWDADARGYRGWGADIDGPHRMKPLDWDRNLYLAEYDLEDAGYGKLIVVSEGGFFRVGHDAYLFSNWDSAISSHAIGETVDADGWTTLDQSGGRLLAFFADIGRSFADGVGGGMYVAVDSAGSPGSYAQSVAGTWFEEYARDHVGRILQYLPSGDPKYAEWAGAYVVLGGEAPDLKEIATNQPKPIFGNDGGSTSSNEPKPIFGNDDEPKPIFDPPPDDSPDGLRARAESGEVAAQADLGRAYYFGDEGFETDDATAFYWFREAGRAGDAESQSFLGYMYAEGIGVERDEVAAAAWYERAADQNNVFSQSMLGDIYRDGIGVPADKAEAYKWYSLAAEQGDEEAINGLGRLIVTMTPDEVTRGQRMAQTWKDINGY